jgi:hypothetical protein
MGYDSVYTRLSREKGVYLATGMGRSLIQRTSSEYREHALTTLGSELAQTMEINANKKVLKLKKSNSLWTATEGGLAAENIEPLVSGLLNVRISDFASGKEPEKETGLDKPLISVTISSQARKVLWKIGKAKAEGKSHKPLYHYARTEDRSILALVPVYDVENLLKLLGVKTSR